MSGTGSRLVHQKQSLQPVRRVILLRQSAAPLRQSGWDRQTDFVFFFPTEICGKRTQLHEKLYQRL